MRQIIMHPATYAELSKKMHFMGTPLVSAHSIAGIAVVQSPHVPIRDIQKQWRPPKSGRFVALGPEDESWARDLGIGTTYEVDAGPYVMMINMPPMSPFIR